MREKSDVGRAMGGDRAAFARLYERYGRPVFLDLVARLRVREDAEDALQLTFLSAWSALPRLRHPERFVGWLFRIGRNKARDLGCAPRGLTRADADYRETATGAAIQVGDGGVGAGNRTGAVGGFLFGHVKRATDGQSGGLGNAMGADLGKNHV